MTKLVCISDTHNNHHQLVIPDGDILLHAGDATMLGTKEELEDFIRWFAKQNHTHKVFVAGNHDFGLETDVHAYVRFFNKRGRKLGDLDTIRTHILELCTDLGVTYLNNTGVTIHGFNIWGSPDQPAFCGWAFNRSHKYLEEHWQTIPEDTNILVTHCPSYGILDTLENGDMVGDVALMKKINILPSLKLHICGHIHPAHGTFQVGDLTYVNASILDDSYQVHNQPITIEL